MGSIPAQGTQLPQGGIGVDLELGEWYLASDQEIIPERRGSTGRKPMSLEGEGDGALEAVSRYGLRDVISGP
jgi:hypothetical protein